MSLSYLIYLIITNNSSLGGLWFNEILKLIRPKKSSLAWIDQGRESSMLAGQPRCVFSTEALTTIYVMAQGPYSMSLPKCHLRNEGMRSHE